MPKMRKNKLFLPACVLLALLLAAGAVLALIYLLPGQAGAVTALSHQNGLVSPDSAFLVTGKAAASEEALRESLSLSPAIAYTLEQEDEGGFLLTPLQLLDAGSRLVITLAGTDFPFQVENRLMLVSHFPADEGRAVPVTSGIEFTFNSRGLSTDQFGNALQLDPPVAGSISYGDRRFAFYPQEALADYTTYQVTLSGSLTADDGAALGQDVVFSFTTGSQAEEETRWMFQFYNTASSYNVLTDDTPLIQAYLDEQLLEDGGEVSVSLHRFDGPESYRSALEDSLLQDRYKYHETVIDTRQLSHYADFSLQPIPAQQGEQSWYSSQYLLEFPEPLPEGWYAATFSALTGQGIEITRQLLVQSSDLSVFTMLSGNDLAAWVNDASTGRPVSGAALSWQGAFPARGTTGDDGLLQQTVTRFSFSPEDYSKGTILTVTAGEHTFIDGMYFYAGEGDSLTHHYYTYLFTDRPLYHTTDTIRVWGAVRPRHEGAPPLPSLALTLEQNGEPQEISLLPDGTFQAQVGFSHLTANYWAALDLSAGEESLETRYLQIEDFVKPVYTASTWVDQPVYLATGGDEIGISAEVSTFDGAPTPQMELELSSWNGLDIPRASLITGEQGIAQGTGIINQTLDTWYPQSYSYQLRSAGAQSEPLVLNGEAHVIHRDLLLSGSVESAGSHSSLLVTTHQLTTEGVADASQLYREENLRGAALSKPVTARLHRIYYTKELIGTYYDFIDRQRKDSYYYSRHDEVESTVSFTTQNGEYRLENLPRGGWDETYYVELTSADSQGRPVTVHIYLGSVYERAYGSEYGAPRYLLNKQAQEDGQAAFADDGYYFPNRSWVQSVFEDNEAVTFQLERNDQPLEQINGRILYGVAQNGFSQLDVTGQAVLTLPYGETLLPNYVLTGAYFDGRYVYSLEDKWMSYQPTQRALDVQVSAGRTSYLPGEAASVEVVVTESLTGQAAGGAQVTLSVVDEAIFALAEQNADILGGLYQHVYDSYVQKYASFLPIYLSGAGEKGGGGGGEADTRSQFEDTAFFHTVQAGADGKAVFDFTLPDNITAWRLTALALTPENHAGHGSGALAATKPFFLLPVVSDTLLEGDAFSIGLRGGGTAVSSANQVEYTATVEGQGFSETRQGGGTLREYATLSFSALPAGDYTITISGACGPYSDSVRLPFTVTASALEVSLAKTFLLEEGIDIEPLRYPVTIAFYHKGWQDYNRVLRSVQASSHGIRADMRLARAYTAQRLALLGSWYDNALLEEDLSDLSSLQGPLRLFPYDNSDLELTVLACVAAPDLVSPAYLNGWTPQALRDSADWTTGRPTSAYLAQALSKEQPSANLSALLQADQGLDYIDRIYIGLAMALGGQDADARQAYEALVTPNLRELTGLSGQSALYIPGMGGLSESDCTAAASLFASVLQTQDSHGLARYLVEKKSRFQPYLLEQMAYLTYLEPSESSTASFSYSQAGQTRQVDLEHSPVTMTFGRKELEEAGFLSLTGQVYADVYYTGSAAEASGKETRIMSLTKQVEALDGGTPRVGDMVRVTLTPDFSGLDPAIGNGYLTIDDYIPSGMRYEQTDGGRYTAEEYGWYLESRQGQRLRFQLYYGGGSQPAPIVYYARCTLPGEYVVESARLTSTGGEGWGASSRGTVVIA